MEDRGAGALARGSATRLSGCASAVLQSSVAAEGLHAVLLAFTLGRRWRRHWRGVVQLSLSAGASPPLTALMRGFQRAEALTERPWPPRASPAARGRRRISRAKLCAAVR